MIDRFDGEYAFLSNYSTSPFKDECGDFFPTMEHRNAATISNITTIIMISIFFVFFFISFSPTL